MMDLFIPNKLKEKVTEWREKDYKCDYPIISEILNFSIVELEVDEKSSLRYLRKAQFEALELYWYLRLIENTPTVFELYKKFYSPKQFIEALGLKYMVENLPEDFVTNEFVGRIINKIRDDDNFVKLHRLEATRESLTLKYPSYILALAMGAGKTILIGAIIATEFAMALEYPDANFVKNALVFAPGKTILGALKEISNVPYENILPERLYKQFIINIKFTYTRDGEKDIPICDKSTFNIIVTNTEKIRIQKQNITRSIIKDLLVDSSQEDIIKQEIANRRLLKIASLPNLAIFSDEAHHTYGQALDKELKRVRQTIDYLAEKTNVLVVINTTGTPYYKKQVLNDVVYWYGLSQGIKDGILKEVKGNIIGYQDINDEEFIKDVITDFINNYKDVKIYDGSLAKLAIYFPNIDDLTNAKPTVEKTLINLGIDPLKVLLEVHNKSPEDIKDLFDNRINNPHLPYRIFLLVNKGTEGWNCLSLFATALARKLSSSNNFCLQAASRCLRQIPGNMHKAKIYLSQANVKLLDSQLRETYGESLDKLNRTSQNIITNKLVLRKTEIPPISVKRKIQKVVPIDKEKNIDQIGLKKPDMPKEKSKKIIYDLSDIPDRKSILITKEEEKIIIEEDFIDIYSFSIELASLYRLPLMPIYDKIKDLYPDGEIPEKHAYEIKKEIEKKVKNYRIVEEEIEQALALIKLDGFNKEEKDGGVIYTTEIIYHKDRAQELLVSYENFKNYKNDFGFHYTPYNFDSKPEIDFFTKLLEELNEDPDNVQDIYFTGGLTDPQKTDFFFEYKGKDDKWHNYYPDFLIRKKDGKLLIVEIKMERLRNDEIDGEDGLKAAKIREIQGLNPDKLKYEILFTDKAEIAFENMQKIKNIIYENGGNKNV